MPMKTMKYFCLLLCLSIHPFNAMFMDNNYDEGVYDLYPQLRDFMGSHTEELDYFNDSNLTVGLENTAHDQIETNPTTDHNHEPLTTLNNSPAEQDTAQIDSDTPAQQTDQLDQAENGTFLCEWDNETCKKSFGDKEQFALHVKQHGDTSARDQQLKEFVCTWKGCGRSFQRREGLINHLRTHSGAVLRCPLCSKTFVTDFSLQRHINGRHSETKSSDFICNLCGDSFTKKGALTNHIKNKHSKGGGAINTETPQSNDEITDLQTATHSSQSSNNFSETTTTTHQSLHWRVDKQAGSEEQESSESENSAMPTVVLVFEDEGNEHYCLWENCECNDEFNDPVALNKHVGEHFINYQPKDSEFSCPWENCRKKFTRKPSFKNHLYSHSGIRFQCPKCDSKFQTTATLKSHFQEKHRASDTVNETFYCKDCQKSFESKKQLYSHKYRIHTQTKKHLCSHTGCGKLFDSKSKLQAHINTHNGVIFTCDRCNQAFSYKSALNVHINKGRCPNM